ncbi:unnamed protein product [Adineta ricciae]|uniref:Uncharacterized protein n=1 Tax=Adineta ricciae TaxID=249248 RepID=A0A814S4G1_ADIRI|nr:unnamed protein product [Adineta ricciae]CAF1521925.1 unnamed protein product [Adineta ricciae]
MKSKDLENIVLSKYRNGDTPTEIHRDLNGGIVLTTIKRWCQMIRRCGSVYRPDTRGGPRIVRTKENIRKVKSSLRQTKKEYHLGSNIRWIFQQNGAMPHQYHLTQQWYETNFPSFINKDRWSSNSPDVNPLDYSIWDELANAMDWSKAQSKAALIQQLKFSVKTVHESIVFESCTVWTNRLYRLS